MTYALAWPLQEAVYQALAGDPAVASFVAGRIYDAPPPTSELGPETSPYITLGDELVDDWSTADGHGARHTFAVSVHAERRGFADAKRCAGAVSDLLTNAMPGLNRGRIVQARFLDARTRRAQGDAFRTISMRFQFLLEDTAQS